MEKHTMLALSTGHITKETGNLMDANQFEQVILYPKNPFGWFVYIPEASEFDELKDSDCPEDLYLCMKYALDNGCDWLMIDCGVDINEAPELPVYDW